MALARSIVQLRGNRCPYELVMNDGTVFLARTIVIATGARYNKPAAVPRKHSPAVVSTTAPLLLRPSFARAKMWLLLARQLGRPSRRVPFADCTQGVHARASARPSAIDVAISHSTDFRSVHPVGCATRR